MYTCTSICKGSVAVFAHRSDLNEIWYVESMAYESMIYEKITFNCQKILKYIIFCFVTKLAIQGVVLGPLTPVYVTLLLRFLWIVFVGPCILF